MYHFPLKRAEEQITVVANRYSFPRPCLTFHFIHTTDHTTFRPQNVRVIESVFYHHPNAKVILHFIDRNMMTLRPLLRIRDEAGYNLQLKEHHLENLIQTAIDMPNSAINEEAARSWMSKIEIYRKEKYWYAQYSDGLRLLFLYTQGGVYMDTDVIVVKPLDQLHNVAGFASNAKLVNNAVLIFDKGNSFLGDCINEYFSTFKTEVWDFNGPQLLTRVQKREPYSSCQDRAAKRIADATSSSMSIGYKNCLADAPEVCSVEILEEAAFSPIRWNEIGKICFKAELNASSVASKVNASKVKEDIEKSSYVVHAYNKISSEFFMSKLKPNTVCHWAYNLFCIFCDEVL